MCKTIQITLNKFFEIQLDYFKDSGYFFDVHCHWTHKCDQAGFEFVIELYGLYLGVKIYDCRHWDDDSNNWQEYIDEI